MAEYLRIFVLFLLLAFTLQDDSAKPRKESATVDYNDLIGTFDDDLRNDLGNLALGAKSFQVRMQTSLAFCLQDVNSSYIRYDM